MKLTKYTRSVLQLLGIAVFIYLLYLIKATIIYLIIAAIISLVVKPVTNWLAQRKIRNHYLPRTLAAAITIVLLFSIVTLANYLIIPSFLSEIAVLSSIDFHAAISGLESEFSNFEDFVATFDMDLSDNDHELKKSILGFINVSTLTSAFGGIVGSLGNLAIASFAIIFMLFFFVKEKNLSHSIFLGIIPDRHVDRWEHIIPKIKNTLFRYFRGLLVQMTGIFTLVFLGLKFFVGLESAMVIALFAALVNLIPYIGPIFGMAFGLIIGVGQAYALGLDVHYGIFAVKILMVFGVTQATDNFFFQPIIFSNSINAHPLEIFVVIMVAGSLAGAAGMLVAVPFYSVLRIFSKEFLQRYKPIRSLTKNV